MDAFIDLVFFLDNLPLLRLKLEELRVGSNVDCCPFGGEGKEEALTEETWSSIPMVFLSKKIVLANIFAGIIGLT